jgi:hypothetical protein
VSEGELAILRELADAEVAREWLLAVVLTSLGIKVGLFLIIRAYLKRAEGLLFAVKGWANFGSDQRQDAKELNRQTAAMDSERIPAVAKVEEVKQKVEEVRQAVCDGTEQVLSRMRDPESGTMPRPSLPPP